MPWQPYSARNAALGVAAVLPPALSGDPQPRTPFVFEMSGERAIVALPGEMGTAVLYDPAAARSFGPVDGPVIFVAGGAQILEAAFAPRNATRNRGLVLRSSRDGTVVRTIRALTDFAQRILVTPDERLAVVTYERRAELVTLATGATTVLHDGMVLDAAIRGDGRELALSVFCRDDEPCTTRILRIALPSGRSIATLDSRERMRPAYAPSNDAMALVHAAGVVIQPLDRGWTSTSEGQRSRSRPDDGRVRGRSP